MAKADVVSVVNMVLDESASSRISYLDFLNTISKFHKYNLDQQASLCAFAGSDYTAVAEERIWNQAFHANIMPNSNGIELLDENAPNGVKFVYDASSTDLPEDRREKLLWRFDGERDIAVFRGIADEGESPINSILQVCWNIQDSYVNKDLSGPDILLLSESIGYVLMKRLGFDREADLLVEQTITEESFQEANTSLEDVSLISRELLNGIQDYVQKGKGRGQDFPLQEAMLRIQDIISRHAVDEKMNGQEISTVEASATEAENATKEASEPKEAEASTVPPAESSATEEADASVAEKSDTLSRTSENTFEQGSLFDNDNMESNVGDFVGSYTKNAESDISDPAISAVLSQENSTAEAVVTEAVAATQEAAGPEESVDSAVPPAETTATEAVASVAEKSESSSRISENLPEKDSLNTDSVVTDSISRAVEPQEEKSSDLDLSSYLDASVFFLSKDADYVSAGDFKNQHCRIRVFLYDNNKLGCMIENKDFVGQLFVENMRDAFHKTQNLSSTFLPDADSEVVASAIIENFRALVDRKYLAYAHPGYGSVHEVQLLSKEDYASLGIDYNGLHDNNVADSFADKTDLPIEVPRSSLRQALENNSEVIDKIKDLNDIIQDLDSKRQENSTVEASANEAEDATKEASEPKEADASPVPSAETAATETVASVAAENDSFVVTEYSRETIDSRVYFISSDGKRSNKPKPSMMRIDVSLRDDGAAYIDIATHNRYSGAGILADDPQDAYEFALHTPLIQNFNPNVVADAIFSDYQEMMHEHNISVPVIVDQRRFDISPDGVDVMEYAYDSENDRWTPSGPSPDNHLRFVMRYMSNGRVDVSISDSVTGQSRNFTDYDNLYNSSRAIIYDVVSDSNAELIANWVVQHATLMERAAKKLSQQENRTVEASVTEAVDATKEAAGPEEAVSSAEASAVDPATDDSSVAADDFIDSINVEEYFKLAGVQVVPANRSLEFMAYAKEHFANESTDFGKFVIINDPDMVTGETSFTVPGNGSEPVTYHEKPDYVLHILGVNMEAFRNALAKYDGTNLDEVALPSNNPSNPFIEVLSDGSIQQENTSVEIPATEAVDATQETAGLKEAGASPVPPAETTATVADASVAADDGSFDIPVITDRRRFDMSPDGLELVEFSSTPDPNTWGTQSRELPENYITVGMEYMSNGRFDVKIFDSVTEDEKSFSAFSHNELMDSGRKVFSEMLPDSDDADLIMLSSRLLTHAILMERRFNAIYRDHQSLSSHNEEQEYADFMEFYSNEQQENSTVEASATEAEDATKEAVEPKEAGASSVPPAETTATEADASVADGKSGDFADNDEVSTDTPKYHGGKKGDAFQNNIKAIQTLKILEKESRSPNSPEEEVALRGYSGFGNLSEVFDENNESWKSERDLLKSVLSNEEFLAARSSVLSAFYTDPAIVSAIYDGISHMGFNNGNILEPSCGIGNFFSNMPSSIREKSHLFGVELDLITGRIARQLHPDADISIQGFESTSFPDGSFDLSITNVPFENYKIQGRSVHDYFLLRMAQQTRPGGLMIAITSRYSMDKKDSSTREDLARQCELVKAIRLPNTAFRDAGTDATTDILIFRRREKDLGYNDALPSWIKSIQFEDDPNISVNPYFINHPEDVIGSLEKKSTAYGFDLTCKPKENVKDVGDIADEVVKAMSSVRAEYVPLSNPLPVPQQLHNDNANPYSFFIKGDDILYRGSDNANIQSLSDLHIDKKDMPQILQLIRLRDLTREVIRSQQFTDNDDALHLAQERLHSVYQDYVNTFGNLHTKKTKQIFEEDCSFPLLLSLENTDSKGNVESLSDIFTKRTIRPHIPPTHVDTPQEALIVSMTEHGNVDMEYMERLTGMSFDKITEELEYKELFWDERSHSFLSSDEYLSGDIREKMEYLEKRREFITDQMDRDIWDFLIPPVTNNDDEYVAKNDIEKSILDDSSSYRYTSDSLKYLRESTDRDFCFAVLMKYNGGLFYRLPDSITSDPLFCLDAGLLYGNQVSSNDAVMFLTNIVNAMQIQGVHDSTYEQFNDYSFLEFLQNGTEKEYPQIRAIVQYLRDISKDYDGTNGDELVARTQEEWPRILQEWQDKYNEIFDKGELLGFSKMKRDLERIDKNFAALKEVCPKDLSAEEISVRLGASWIPPSDIEQFMTDVFGSSRNVEYTDVHHGQWKIASSRSSYGISRFSEKAKEYSTDEFDASALLEKILNLQMAVVKDKIYVGGQEKEVVNQEKTVLAQQKQEMIKDAFSKWIWQDEERKDRLVKYYNRHFNNIRPREYNGSYLDFPGMNPEIQLRSHQKDAIAHTLYGGNTLLAHCVGAGKTFEMVASIMESKRLGLSSKAMLVVPGHLTEQIGAEFMRLYPTANILVATKKDFEKANRKEFCAKIATHNWDAVILGFTQFEKIAMSKEYLEKFTKDELSRLISEIAVAKKAEGKSLGVRQMERMKKKLEEKLHSIQDKKPKDDVINFEDLGIDRLYVDEAHNFKNLAVITKLQRLPGINTENAQKSTDFYQKVQYINNKTNYKGLVFATGTMISNSMTELYVMQQYLQPDRLYSEGLRHFDTWATTFGEIATISELAPEGKGIRPRQRFSKFCNLPELMSMVKEFADIKTEDMLDLPTPNVEYHVESVPASPEQKAMVDELADRAMAIRNKAVDTSLPENNMLSVTNEGRKLALDQRMLNPALPDNPDSKVNRCVDNVFRIWEDSKDFKGTQLVFSDLGTPDKSRFNVYDDIKQKLIAKGVPADEIAFIHDANNEKQKEELFAKVRDGKVRVLLGSTGKLGTGTNVQDKLVASHDLDVPWKPSDLEQRKGRIARQGNMNEKVDVYRYVTEGTFDSYMWQILENKQRFISQILTSKTPARVTEDADELVLTCAEVKAIATGSPLIREKLELDVEVERLKIARKGFMAEQAARKKFIEITGPQKIEACKKDKACAEADAETMKSFVQPDDGTLIVLGGKRFSDGKEAGEAIVKAIKAGHGTELTGSYKGMKFSLSPGFSWRMNLTGKMSYSEEVHLGSFAENFNRIVKMEEEIAAYSKKMDDEISDIQKNLDEAKEFSLHSFAREDEYQQKLLRLQELSVLLSDNVSKDQKSIEFEQERRVEFLRSFNTEEFVDGSKDSELTAAYIKNAVMSLKEDDSPWSEFKDQVLAENLLQDGYDSSAIANVLLKFSPKVYDGSTAERIVSQANSSILESNSLSACR